jgi:hypothetical protein
MNKKIEALTLIAEEKMKYSRDPIHDLSHVRRVVGYVEEFAAAYSLTEKQTQALVLAAWWHDVSRTIVKGTSFIVMPLFDDIISALMLWAQTIRYGLFGSVAGMAARMIFCKSMGTGTVLTRIFLRKNQRILLDILKDADMIDVFHAERIAKVLQVVEGSYLHRLGYRFIIRWHLQVNKFPVKTAAAKRRIIEIMKRLFEWMKEPSVYAWHLKQFGQEWITRTLAMIQRAFDSLCAREFAL